MAQTTFRHREPHPAVIPPMGWLVWGLSAALFCYALFHRMAPSVMIDQLMADLAVSGAMLGNLSALYYFAYASLQVPAGAMIDRWGPRIVITVAGVTCAAGSLLFGLGPSIEIVYLGRLLIGIGAGFFFVGTLAIATRWFPAHRFALLSGLTMLAGLSGGVAGQAPLSLVVEAAGWRAAMVAAGLLGLALAVVFAVVARDRPDGSPESAHRSGGMLAGLGEIVRNPHNWLLAVIGASMSAPMLAFAGLWGVSWLMQVHGLSRPMAALVTSLLLAGWAVGSPLAGWMSDRTRKRKGPIVASAAGGLVILLAILYLPISSPWLFAPLFFMCGAILGCMVVLYPLVGETNPAQYSGTAYAFCNMFPVASGALFQPLIGFLLDLGWDGTLVDGARVYDAATYGWAFAVMPAFLAIGLIASLAIRDSGAVRTA